MMTHQPENDDATAPLTPPTLLQTLERNYECLNRKYRAGGFEDFVGKVLTWRDDENKVLSLLSDDATVLSRLPDDRKITFERAIKELWDLTQRADEEEDSQLPGRKLLLLRCRILIYEATDYFLKPEKVLAAFFINRLDGFSDKLEDLELQAEELHGGPFGDDKDSRAKMVKVLLIAALSGINARYREHDPFDAGRVLYQLNRLISFIEHKLPSLHKDPRRPSWGLLGIAYYLKARILSSTGSFEESRTAFRKSADAYLARLRQKEDFLEEGQLTPEEYREKVSLTIRRSALVTAFGDGYLSFVASRLSDALEALTVARAALAQNSGKVYTTYVDMLYFACLGAQHSSNPEKLETVISGLRRCHSTFGKLVRDTHYYHRAGLRLATALFYQAQLPEAGSDPDLSEAWPYIDEAKKYARTNNNKHLLSTALVIESRLEMSRYRPQQAPTAAALGGLKTAETLAIEAAEAASGFIEKELEASTILGEIHVCLAEFNRDNEELFDQHFKSAQYFLRDALTKNRNAANIRIEAVCVLQLARLYLVNKKNEALAFQYFERWKGIEKVEHEYCKALARELEPRLNEPFFFLTATQIGERNWEQSLEEFVNEHALKRFVVAYKQERTRKKVRPELVNYLMTTLHLGKTAVNNRINKNDKALLEKVLEMHSE